MRQAVALVALGVVVGLVLLEGGLRVSGALWLWSRERRNMAALATGADIRVLCVGESTTALGGESSYPRQLERILNQTGGGRRFSVINVGVPGVTTDVVLARLPQQLDRYEPHVVITMLGINDGLVSDGGLRRLPAFSSLRVVKLVYLAISHVREKLGGGIPATPVRSPVVNRALTLFAAGKRADAEATLREALSGSQPLAETAQALVVLLTGSARFAEALQLARGWSDSHPDDAVMHDLVWQVRLAESALALEQRRLDDAETLLAELDRSIPETVPRHRATMLSERATLAELRGDHEVAASQRAAAETLRAGHWLQSTEQNYRELLRIVRDRGIRFVAMQYPLRSVASVRAMLGEPTDVVFVDNDAPFRDGLRRAPWPTWFTDAFAGDFGHTTVAGSQLLAENAARAILATLEDGERRPPSTSRDPMHATKAREQDHERRSRGGDRSGRSRAPLS
jgi:lysophospholipase L1-like esterase